MNKQTVTLSANTSWYLYNFRASTIRKLMEENFHVVCLSPEDPYSQKLTAELGCEWRPLHMNNQGSNPVRELSLVAQFRRHYRDIRPVACLHFTIKNNVYGTWAATSLGIPAINNVSGLGTAFIRPGLVSTIVRWLYKASQPLAFRVFCQNEEDHRLLLERRLVPEEKLELIPGSGVDLERFNPALKQSHEGPLRFLYAGRMLKDKGLLELIAATRAINAQEQRIHLWLCGFPGVENVSAIAEQQLETWDSEPGVSWLGPSDRMETIYAQVDAVVLPSYREGMPRSLLEAGAMGLPVIASDVPGCRTIVSDTVNGLLCRARDTRSLRASMEAMLGMSARQRTTMGEQGRQLVEQQYSEQLVIEATLRAVRSALSR